MQRERLKADFIKAVEAWSLTWNLDFQEPQCDDDLPIGLRQGLKEEDLEEIRLMYKDSEFYNKKIEELKKEYTKLNLPEDVFFQNIKNFEMKYQHLMIGLKEVDSYNDMIKSAVQYLKLFTDPKERKNIIYDDLYRVIENKFQGKNFDDKRFKSQILESILINTF